MNKESGNNPLAAIIHEIGQIPHFFTDDEAFRTASMNGNEAPGEIGAFIVLGLIFVGGACTTLVSCTQAVISNLSQTPH